MSDQRPSRAEPIPPQQLTASQRAYYQQSKQQIEQQFSGASRSSAIADNGALLGPWSVWMSTPDLGTAFAAAQSTISALQALPARAQQVVTLLTAASQRAAYELAGHRTIAISQGFAAEVADALAEGYAPSTLGPAEQLAANATHCLLAGGALPLELYNGAETDLRARGPGAPVLDCGSVFVPLGHIEHIRRPRPRWSNDNQLVKELVMTHVNRVVIGANKDKKSAVIYRHASTHQEVPDLYWRSTLWATSELPVDNTVNSDRAAGVTIREPARNGLIFRVDEIAPNMADTRKRTQEMLDLDKDVKKKYQPTQADLNRDPSMHRTDTCDMFSIAYGEIHLVTDTDEVVLKPGDTAVLDATGQLARRPRQLLPSPALYHAGRRDQHDGDSRVPDPAESLSARCAASPPVHEGRAELILTWTRSVGIFAQG